MRKHSMCLLMSSVMAVSLVAAQAPPAPHSAEPALPYGPRLDLSSMDKSVEPCVGFYHYSCGGLQTENPIPPDQTSWSVYGQLYLDNLTFLRGILDQAAAPSE